MRTSANKGLSTDSSPEARSAEGETSAKAGFTLIELLIVVAIIGLVATIAFVAQGGVKAKRRDVQRVSNMVELQKALALYIAKVQTYPVMTGCLTGTDVVTVGLRTQGFIGTGVTLADPLTPADTASCYYYVGDGARYTLRYTLETNSNAGTAGNHTVVP